MGGYRLLGPGSVRQRAVDAAAEAEELAQEQESIEPRGSQLRYLEPKWLRCLASERATHSSSRNNPSIDPVRRYPGGMAANDILAEIWGSPYLFGTWGRSSRVE